MSTGPRRDVVSSTACLQPSSVSRSAATPTPSSCRATSSTSACVRATTDTCAPSRARACAMPRPMPFVAAVTSATLPAIPKSTSRHPKDVLPPAAINEGPPVAPRPSATVLLVRDGDPWELLMVQRPGGADFAPGAYVFPGGTVHEDDRSFPDELRAAAVRELFEEAGILLAPEAREADAERVRTLVEGGASFADALHEARLTPDCDGLVMLARWVTPPLPR